MKRRSGFNVAAALVALAALLGAIGAVAAPIDPLQATLVAKSKALLDAVATGDKAVWTRTLADGGVFVDEEGKVRSKAQILAEITPLPADTTGSMQILNPHLARSGDVAVLTYDAMETETVSGQTLNSHYHQTDIYRRSAGAWTLFGSHVAILPAEAAPVGPPAPLADFTGVYRFGDKDRIEIAAEGGALTATRDGKTEPLVALGGDHFARKGRPRGERIFVRDAEGHVTGFVDRRDNEDLRWTKEARS